MTRSQLNYQKYHERIKAYQREYYRKNRIKLKIRKAKRKPKPEQVAKRKAWEKAYYLKNREAKLAARKKWAKENREYLNEYHRNYRAKKKIEKGLFIVVDEWCNLILN